MVDRRNGIRCVLTMNLILNLRIRQTSMLETICQTSYCSQPNNLQLKVTKLYVCFLQEAVFEEKEGRESKLSYSVSLPRY